jgi:hypothetical protein
MVKQIKRILLWTRERENNPRLWMGSERGDTEINGQTKDVYTILITSAQHVQKAVNIIREHLRPQNIHLETIEVGE